MNRIIRTLIGSTLIISLLAIGIMVNGFLRLNHSDKVYKAATQIERMSAALASLKVDHLDGRSDSHISEALDLIDTGVTVPPPGPMQGEVFRYPLSPSVKADLIHIMKYREDTGNPRLITTITKPPTPHFSSGWFFKEFKSLTSLGFSTQ